MNYKHIKKILLIVLTSIILKGCSFLSTPELATKEKQIDRIEETAPKECWEFDYYVFPVLKNMEQAPEMYALPIQPLESYDEFSFRRIRIFQVLSPRKALTFLDDSSYQGPPILIVASKNMKWHDGKTISNIVLTNTHKSYTYTTINNTSKTVYVFKLQPKYEKDSLQLVSDTKKGKKTRNLKCQITYYK